MPSSAVSANHMPATNVDITLRISWLDENSRLREIENSITFNDINNQSGPEQTTYNNSREAQLDSVISRIPRETPEDLRGATVRTHLRIVNGEPRQHRSEPSNLHCSDHYWHSTLSLDETYGDHTSVDHELLPQWSSWTPNLLLSCAAQHEAVSVVMFMQLAANYFTQASST